MLCPGGSSPKVSRADAGGAETPACALGSAWHRCRAGAACAAVKLPGGLRHGLGCSVLARCSREQGRTLPDPKPPWGWVLPQEPLHTRPCVVTVQHMGGLRQVDAQPREPMGLVVARMRSGAAGPQPHSLLRGGSAAGPSPASRGSGTNPGPVLRSASGRGCHWLRRGALTASRLQTISCCCGVNAKQTFLSLPSLQPKCSGLRRRSPSCPASGQPTTLVSTSPAGPWAPAQGAQGPKGTAGRMDGAPQRTPAPTQPRRPRRDVADLPRPLVEMLRRCAGGGTSVWGHGV